MSKSKFAITAYLRYATGKTGTFGSTGSRYLHLWTVKPALSGTGGTAVSGGGYAPLDVESLFPTVSTGSTSVATNAAASFTTQTSAAWGDVVAASIHTSTASTSNMVWVDDLDNYPVTISSGVPVSIPAGGIVVADG